MYMYDGGNVRIANFTTIWYHPLNAYVTTYLHYYTYGYCDVFEKKRLCEF